MLAAFEFAVDSVNSTLRMTAQSQGIFEPVDWSETVVPITGTVKGEFTGSTIRILPGTRLTPVGNPTIDAVLPLVNESQITLRNGVFGLTTPAMTVASNGAFDPSVGTATATGTNDWEAAFGSLTGSDDINASGPNSTRSGATTLNNGRRTVAFFIRLGALSSVADVSTGIVFTLGVVGSFSTTPPPATGSISGVKFNDLNGNGVRESTEQGLSNWTIYLDRNNNNVFDTGEPTSITSASGEYRFANLAAGAYSVREVLQTGWRQTFPTGGEHNLTLTAGQNVTARNFGNQRANASIAGTAFTDSDRDGVLDAGEARLANQLVYVDANRNGIRESTELNVRTSSTGEYRFANLVAGSYRIRLADQPAGTTYSVPTTGFHDVTLAASQVVTGRNFGVLPRNTASLSGVVFNDLNRNGLLDATDTRAASVLVYLDLDRDGVRDANEPTATTSSTGEYRFANLAAGSYRVRLAALPAGATLGSPTTGFYDRTLTAGQSITGLLFGLRRN